VNLSHGRGGDCPKNSLLAERFFKLSAAKSRAWRDPAFRGIILTHFRQFERELGEKSSKTPYFSGF
jgi:hypothetical protein